MATIVKFTSNNYNNHHNQNSPSYVMTSFIWMSYVT